MTLGSAGEALSETASTATQSGITPGIIIVALIIIILIWAIYKDKNKFP